MQINSECDDSDMRLAALRDPEGEARHEKEKRHERESREEQGATTVVTESCAVSPVSFLCVLPSSSP